MTDATSSSFVFSAIGNVVGKIMLQFFMRQLNICRCVPLVITLAPWLFSSSHAAEATTVDPINTGYAKLYDLKSFRCRSEWPTTNKYLQNHSTIAYTDFIHGEPVRTLTQQNGKCIVDVLSVNAQTYIAGGDRRWAKMKSSPKNPSIDRQVDRTIREEAAEEPSWNSRLRHAPLIGYANVDGVQTAVYEVRWNRPRKPEMFRFYIDKNDGILRRVVTVRSSRTMIETYYDFNASISYPVAPKVP